jgi:hypothetical protein
MFLIWLGEQITEKVSATASRSLFRRHRKPVADPDLADNPNCASNSGFVAVRAVRWHVWVIIKVTQASAVFR